MTDKAKRKGNPRQQLQNYFVIASSLLILIFSSLGLWVHKYLNNPLRNASMVYLAQGTLQGHSIWIADPNDIDTAYEIVPLRYQTDLRLYPVTEDDELIYQFTSTGNTRANYRLNLRNGQTEPLRGLAECEGYYGYESCVLNIHRHWALFQLQTYDRELERSSLTVNLLNIHTGERTNLYDTHDDDPNFQQTFPQWIPEQDLAVYRVSTESAINRYEVYDPNVGEIVRTIDVIDDARIYLSPNGTYFAQYIEASRELRFFESDSPSEPIANISLWSNRAEQAIILDWHPTETKILIGILLANETNFGEQHLYEYDLQDDSLRQLTDFDSKHATYNADGSLIFVSNPLIYPYEPDMMVIDAISGQQTQSRIDGYTPYWLD